MATLTTQLIRCVRCSQRMEVHEVWKVYHVKRGSQFVPYAYCSARCLALDDLDGGRFERCGRCGEWAVDPHDCVH